MPAVYDASAGGALIQTVALDTLRMPDVHERAAGTPSRRILVIEPSIFWGDGLAEAATASGLP